MVYENNVTRAGDRNMGDYSVKCIKGAPHYYLCATAGPLKWNNNGGLGYGMKGLMELMDNNGDGNPE